jgi:hypothetical protein
VQVLDRRTTELEMCRWLAEIAGARGLDFIVVRAEHAFVLLPLTGKVSEGGSA